MEQLTHITLLSPETAKHLQVEHLEMVVMVILLGMWVRMRAMLMVSPCTGPGPVQDLGHELHQVHRRPREGDHQDRPHQLHQVDHGGKFDASDGDGDVDDDGNKHGN